MKFKLWQLLHRFKSKVRKDFCCRTATYIADNLGFTTKFVKEGACEKKFHLQKLLVKISNNVSSSSTVMFSGLTMYYVLFFLSLLGGNTCFEVHFWNFLYHGDQKEQTNQPGPVVQKVDIRWIALSNFWTTGARWTKSFQLFFILQFTAQTLILPG